MAKRLYKPTMPQYFGLRSKVCTAENRKGESVTTTVKNALKQNWKILNIQE